MKFELSMRIKAGLDSRVALRCLSRAVLKKIKLTKEVYIHAKQRWSPRGRPWPRGHIFKSLALASKPQVLENCPVFGSRTALFFEWLKFYRSAEKCFSGPFFFFGDRRKKNF